MPIHPSLQPPALAAALTKGFAKVLGAMPRRRVVRRRRGRALTLLFRRRHAHPAETPANAVAAADPIAMVVMAIDRLGPAAIRASYSGVNVRVAVPDDQTADVFRAALAVTQRRRVTDRLIEVIVEGEDRPAGRA